MLLSGFDVTYEIAKSETSTNVNDICKLYKKIFKKIKGKGLLIKLCLLSLFGLLKVELFWEKI